MSRKRALSGHVYTPDSTLIFVPVVVVVVFLVPESGNNLYTLHLPPLFLVDVLLLLVLVVVIIIVVVCESWPHGDCLRAGGKEGGHE